MDKKEKKIQVPFQLMDNTLTKTKVPHAALYLYVILKSVCINNHVHIYVEKIKSEEYLDWKSTQTLKKYLKYLKENKYITYDFESIPKHKCLDIEITKIKDLPKIDDKPNYFTEVNIEMIKEIITKAKMILKNVDFVDLKEMALRLFYFYRKNFNRHNSYAFPSYTDINDSTGISREYISTINNFFQNEGIVEIKPGRWCTRKTDEGTKIKLKERNRYVPFKGEK